jgi:Tfp pilus tip-associated adhesin PilY1
MKGLATLIAIIASTLSPDSLAAGIFNPDAQPTGWLGRPGLTNPDLRSGREAIFQLNYTKGPWNGDIFARAIGADAVVAASGPWSPDTAASKLDAMNYDTGRKIGTLNGNSKVAFRWASLSAAQQATIGDATVGPKILNYIRGDRTNEEPNGLSWRGRVHVLGDIQHSTLAYFEHDASTKRLYVGANDGMLHVFDATTGAEVFAYVPSMVIPKLNKLVEKSYVHAYFVDGGITIGRVGQGDATKTILVGSLGAGGKGIYALDVTTPTADNEAAAAGKILWEISAAGSFADLGFTYGTPRIGRLEDGTDVAIFGNGYVNGGSGRAVLYVVNLLTGALVRAIDTGSGTSASPNGLSSPTLVDTDGNGKVDRVYAGDIDGNLWRFDLSNGAVARVFATTPAQAITSPTAVSPHPLGGYLVLFGTGRTLTGDDAADTSVHYVYGIWDGAPAANDVLLTQTLSDHSYGDSQVRTVTRNIPDWTGGSGHHKGWKVALPAGERVTGELPFVKNGRFYFVSTNPTVLYEPPPNGDNWLYEFVVTTGGSPAGPIFDLNNDGAFNASDLAGGCTVSSEITCVPIAKALGSGVFSQPTYVLGAGFSTTLFTYHPDTAATTGAVDDPDDPGVSGGHFGGHHDDDAHGR